MAHNDQDKGHNCGCELDMHISIKSQLTCSDYDSKVTNIHIIHIPNKLNYQKQFLSFF